MRNVNRESPTPLYEQIKLILREQIMMGHYPPNSTLPTESMLCAQYEVSRITVVRALRDLEAEGLITRVQGKGSLVAKPARLDNLSEIAGFSRTVTRAGKSTRSRVLSVDVLEQSQELANTFNLPLNEQITFMRIRRLRYVDDTPSVIMNTIVQEALGRRMLEHDLEHASFYQLYEELLGLPVIRNEVSLTPVVANKEIASLMEVKPGSAHFLFQGLSFLEGNVPVELCLAIFRGSMFYFSTNIYRLREGNAADSSLADARLIGFVA